MDGNEKKNKPKSREYPGVTLSAAISFVEKLKDYPHNRPISFDVAAKECGVSARTKSFTYALSAARQFGLVSTSGGNTMLLLEPATRLVRPTESAETLQSLKIECFKKPKLYSELIAQYTGQSIPQVQILENILVSHYDIISGVARAAADTFIRTATEIGAVHNGVLDFTPELLQQSSDAPAEDVANSSSNLTASAAETGSKQPETSDEFAAPLSVPFGDKRRAILYMPTGATREDAVLVKDTIALVFKRVYGVED
ncbi:MAG: hypothetical protein ACYDHF_08910 [Candidatus Cryosericum sp.]